MSIKIQCLLKLPYIIKLEEEKNYELSFDMNGFDLFKVEFLFNNDENEEYYERDISKNSCKYLLIEADYKKYNYKDFDVRTENVCINKTWCTRASIVRNIPNEIKKDILNEVAKRINNILMFINHKSGMFWIEDISINPISNSLGVFSEVSFYSTNAKISKHIREYSKYYDNYMEEVEYHKLNQLDENMFSDYKEDIYTYKIHKKYLNRAKVCLFEIKLIDFIINIAISIESFIIRYIGEIEPKNDIVYERLQSSNYKYIDKYYNVILKYLKGRSLSELDKELFKSLDLVYKIRNDIMHTGEIDNKKLQKINFKECKNILDKVCKTFETIEQL